jgi:hypothetical protein
MLVGNPEFKSSAFEQAGLVTNARFGAHKEPLKYILAKMASRPCSELVDSTVLASRA